MQITTLGDLLLDVIASLDEPLAPDDDRVATTRVTAGGQAANVAAWAASLGAVGAARRRSAATTRPASSSARELAARGVEVAGPAGGRTGVVVAIAAAGERTMVSDRGSAPELAPEELEAGVVPLRCSARVGVRAACASRWRLRRCGRASSRARPARRSRSTSRRGR